jgi:hypothetical protein
MLTDAYNWCDSRCERCPLRSDCPVAIREAQRRWVHEARGEDPDDWAVIMKDVEEELGRALQLLVEMAERDGADLDDDSDAPPPSLASRRLSQSGLDFVVAVRDALATIGGEPTEREVDEGAELVLLSAIIARKTARLSSAFEADPQPLEEREVWRGDWVPNVILVTRVLGTARAAVRRFFDVAETRARVEAPLDVIERTLAPLTERVPPEARRTLETMIADGTAPSPFVIVEHQPV